MGKCQEFKVFLSLISIGSGGACLWIRLLLHQKPVTNRDILFFLN